jgi:hypothetical protein
MADSYKDITITDGSIVNSLTDVPDFIEPEHISLHNQTTDIAISSSLYTITNNSRNGYGAYDAATISLNAGAVSNSDVIRIIRNSSHVVNSVNYPITDFTNGSNLTAEALDKNSVQCIFRAKELEEQGVTVPSEYLTQTEGDARYLQSFTETNDLSSAVTWANIPDANVPESAVTQHEAALTVTESQVSDLGTYLTGNQTITLTGDATGSGTTSITVTVLDDSHNHVIANVDGLQAELDSKLESYTETNDLSSAVTWANVPDANITESSVTQHQAALSITESQISDLDHYADADVDTHLNTSTATSDEVLSWNGTDYAWVSNAGGGGGGGSGLSNVVEDTTPQLGGDLDLNSNDITGTGNVNITGSVTATGGNSTQWNTAYGWGDHSTAGYLTSFTETNDLSTAVTWANVPDANITQSSVTQHQAALSITESQISDLGTYLENVVEDTTPQLGGDLDLNSNDITGTGNLDFTGNVTASATSTETRFFDIGVGRTGNGASYADFVGDTTYSDYGLRVIRAGGGANTTSSLIHRGTGALNVQATDAGSINLKTNNTNRLQVESTGTIVFKNGIQETAYNLTGTALDPDNGTIQYKTLAANTTLTDSIEEGEAITLMIDDGSAYTLTFPTITWVNDGGTAPTLATTGYTVFVLWKVSTTLYGALVGDGS